MKKILSSSFIAFLFIWHELVFGFTINDVGLTGRGPFNENGVDYVNFSSLAGKSLAGSGEFVVKQNNVILYRGVGPYTFPTLTNFVYPLVIEPIPCNNYRYGCSNILYHLDKPKISTSGYTPHNFNSDELHLGTQTLKGVGMRGNSYTITAPNGEQQTGLESFPSYAFSANINQTGVWTVSVTGTPLFSSTPKTLTKTFNVYASLNLGAEHYINAITVDPLLSLEVSEWSSWSWFPTYIEIGIGADDGQQLNGVSVVDEKGNSIALSGWFAKVAQPYTWQSRYFTVKSNSPRALSVQWWATTTPNVVDLGADHNKRALNLISATTIQASQWANWGYNPANIGFGFTSNDGLPLDGIQVRDKEGRIYPLSGWWTAVNQPFAWEPVQLIIPSHNRKIQVEWWASGQ